MLFAHPCTYCVPCQIYQAHEGFFVVASHRLLDGTAALTVGVYFRAFFMIMSVVLPSRICMYPSYMYLVMHMYCQGERITS